MSPIIQISELTPLTGNQNFILVDANGSPDAIQQFNTKHLQSACHVDLNKELANIKADAASGGRHPLPDIHAFAITIGNLGIDPNSHIVVYDNHKGGNAAARFWWMMRSLGHHKIQVLNGTSGEAVQAGFPATTNVFEIDPKPPYPVTNWLWPMADMQTVEQMAQDQNQTVIDVRDTYRFNGESEPIDLVAGHIPGAINIPFSENLDATGHFLSPVVLRMKYQPLFTSKNADQICVHCGSGVTACHTILAMDYAGLPIPKLYVGSWSEWSRNGKEIGKSLVND